MLHGMGQALCVKTYVDERCFICALTQDAQQELAAISIHSNSLLYSNGQDRLNGTHQYKNCVLHP